MTLLDDALAARRDRLVAALHDHPVIRDRLTTAEITTAVDQALATIGLPALLATVQLAQAVADAIDADLPTPPASVTAALGDYAPAANGVNADYGIFEP